MRTEEVLKAYASGERNFRGVDLRGQLFRGENLSEADLSKADLRGTDFSNAILRRTKFIGVRAEPRGQSIIFQAVIAVFLALMAGFVCAFSGAFAGEPFAARNVQQYTIAPGIASLVTFAATVFAIARYGFIIQSFAMISGVGAVAGLIALIISNTVLSASPNVVSSAMGSAVAGAGTGTVASAFALVLSFSSSFLGYTSVTVAIIASIATTLVITNNFVVAIPVALVIVFLGLYVSRKAWEGDENFALLLKFSVVFGTIGGTQFYKADLTDADFTQANLKNANFNDAILTRVLWKSVEKLDRARLGHSILTVSKVRNLLISRFGYGQDYSNCNLRGANLIGVNLEKALLKQADLNEATLQKASLRDANLTQVQAIGADFTDAYMTGACLENWNIDCTTNFHQVDCQYIFLVQGYNVVGESRYQERRPYHPNEIFQPGDFEKLYRKVFNTIEILLRNGIDKRALTEALQKLMQSYSEINFDAIQAIEKKGDDVLLILKVPEDADKASISYYFRKFYEDNVLQLREKVDDLQAQYNAGFKDLLLELTRRPLNVINNQIIGKGKIMRLFRLEYA
jgi:uncharacterized protein YjbI with pentapeptide repeats